MIEEGQRNEMLLDSKIVEGGHKPKNVSDV